MGKYDLYQEVNSVLAMDSKTAKVDRKLARRLTNGRPRNDE